MAHCSVSFKEYKQHVNGYLRNILIYSTNEWLSEEYRYLLNKWMAIWGISWSSKQVTGYLKNILIFSTSEWLSEEYPHLFNYLNIDACTNS